MANFVVPVRASQTLTVSANPANTETVTIAGKVYTFQTSLTNVDGNVLIGANAEGSIDNLVAAINLGAGAGTAYAAAMTLNASARAVKGSASTLVAYAKIAGAAGNLIATTEACANSAWGAGTMAGGTGDPGNALAALLAQDQLNAAAVQAITEVLGLEA